MIYDIIRAALGGDVERSQKHGALLRGSFVNEMFPVEAAEYEALGIHRSSALDLWFESDNDDDAKHRYYVVRAGRHYGPTVSCRADADVKMLCRIALSANAAKWRVQAGGCNSVIEPQPNEFTKKYQPSRRWRI